MTTMKQIPMRDNEDAVLSMVLKFWRCCGPTSLTFILGRRWRDSTRRRRTDSDRKRAGIEDPYLEQWRKSCRKVSMGSGGDSRSRRESMGWLMVLIRLLCRLPG